MSDSTPRPVPPAEIRQQLRRMLNSQKFKRAEARGRLLKYLVEQALESKDPTEEDIARDVYGAPPDWIGNRGSRPAVNLLRLKDDLATYYSPEGEGRSDPVVIRIALRTAIAEYRSMALLHAPAQSEILAPTIAAAHNFFVADGSPLRCIVTGQSEDVDWHLLDGDRCNGALSNLIPLCRQLRSHIQALKDQKRTTSLPELDPKRLSDVLAPRYFRQWNVASAYGCAALAFDMGLPPCGDEPVNRQLFRLCDVIHYARHHFFEPMVHQVVQSVVLPFLSRIEVIDPIAALRLSLQFTALLEEGGYYEDAERSLFLATHLNRDATPRGFERGSLNAFTLLRRQAQLLAERAPEDAKFHELLQDAQEQTAKMEDRILTLNVVRVHRWLRLGSPKALRDAFELLAPLILDYQRTVFRDNQLVLPKGLGAADFSEIFLLAGITACRLRPDGWKDYAEETITSAQSLMRLGGHILPAEYGKFIAGATGRNNSKATRMLRAEAASRLRSPLRADARANIAAIIKCLTRLRLLESRDENLLGIPKPDL